jgi:hypothetical protein
MQPVIPSAKITQSPPFKNVESIQMLIYTHVHLGLVPLHFRHRQNLCNMLPSASEDSTTLHLTNCVSKNKNNLIMWTLQCWRGMHWFADKLNVLRIWDDNFVTQSIVQGKLTRCAKVNTVDKSWKGHLFPVSHEAVQDHGWIFTSCTTADTSICFFN